MQDINHLLSVAIDNVVGTDLGLAKAKTHGEIFSFALLEKYPHSDCCWMIMYK